MPSPLPRWDRWVRSLMGRPIPPVSLFANDDGLPRFMWRVGSHVNSFEACSAFTRVTACSTRCTAKRYICLEGSDGFVTSTAAPIASGWSDRVGRAGLAPAGKTLPCHGAHINIDYRTSSPHSPGPVTTEVSLHPDRWSLDRPGRDLLQSSEYRLEGDHPPGALAPRSREDRRGVVHSP